MENKLENKKVPLGYKVEGHQKFTDSQPAERPGFPFLILIISIFKDVVDSLDYTIAGILVTKIINIIIFIILFRWCHHKIKGKWWKKGAIKWLWKRYIQAALIEIIPWVSIIPANTIIVLMIHHKEKKLVRIFNFALEKVHDHIKNMKNSGGFFEKEEFFGE